MDSKAEERGALLESKNTNALAAPRRRARGGKTSRARRLEKYQESKATTPAAPATSTALWDKFAQGVLRQTRAKLRDGVRAAWARASLNRAKVRAAAWREWTSRSLDISGIDMCLEEECQFVTGEALAPLSRRDVWILSRAVFFMVKNQLRDPHDDTFHPESIRYYRHVLDWLRVPTDNMEPHFFHTAAVVREENSAYTSDQDDGCTSD